MAATSWRELVRLFVFKYRVWIGVISLMIITAESTLSIRASGIITADKRRYCQTLRDNEQQYNCYSKLARELNARIVVIDFNIALMGLLLLLGIGLAAYLWRKNFDISLTHEVRLLFWQFVVLAAAPAIELLLFFWWLILYVT